MGSVFSLAARTAADSFQAGTLCRYAKLVHTTTLAEQDDEPPAVCETGVKQGIWVVFGLVSDHAGGESCEDCEVGVDVKVDLAPALARGAGAADIAAAASDATTKANAAINRSMPYLRVKVLTVPTVIG